MGTVAGPEGPITVYFGEASTEQRAQCYSLAGAEFGYPLSDDDYREREIYLGERPLTANGGCQYWCLFVELETGLTRVLASCKTIRRQLLLANATCGIWGGVGYCIASVVTDPQYRRMGLTSLLLQHLGDWMDRLGGATASMLYSSIGNFYERRGWKKKDCTLCVLTRIEVPLPKEVGLSLPQSFLLGRKDIPQLCDMDTTSVKDNFGHFAVRNDRTYLAVVPNVNTITWLHDRAEFISQKLFGRVPLHFGTKCNRIWMYWFHDFRKNQLAIQRVHIPMDSEPSDVSRELAAGLLDAIEEARKWNFPKVIYWKDSQDLSAAVEFLVRRSDIVATKGERSKARISVRWIGQSDEATDSVELPLEEFYAWN
ncbi:hypothetical protein F5Y18DRAFT_417379 [Xylariaceae sp. FL1019]|nr:hypothetical protein F5Y18DRAFT_417379 [Xylariaceae sp. FL1019]